MQSKVKIHRRNMSKREFSESHRKSVKGKLKSIGVDGK